MWYKFNILKLSSIQYVFNLPKENDLSGELREIFKGSSFYCLGLPDHKMLWGNRLERTLEICLEKGVFS